MFYSSQAITLSLKRYTDSSYIAKAFTEKHGLVTFFIRVNKKKLPSLRNKFYALNIVKLEYRVKKENDSLSTLKEIETLGAQKLDFNIHQNALKSFIAEVLIIILKAGDVQHELFMFSKKMVEFVESTYENYIYVSIYFCVHIFDLLGISIVNNTTLLSTLGITSKEINFLKDLAHGNELDSDLVPNSIDLFVLFDNLITYFKSEFHIEKPIHSLDVFRTIYQD